MATIRKVKNDIAKYHGCKPSDLATLFDSGWLPGRGDPTTKHRTINLSHPADARMMYAVSFYSDRFTTGSAKVAAVWR